MLRRLRDGPCHQDLQGCGWGVYTLTCTRACFYSYSPAGDGCSPLKYIHGHKCTLKRTTQDFSHTHTKHTTFPFQPPPGYWKFSRCKMEELLRIQGARSHRSKDKHVPHFSAAFRRKSLQPVMCLKCRGKEEPAQHTPRSKRSIGKFSVRGGAVAFWLQKLQKSGSRKEFYNAEDFNRYFLASVMKFCFIVEELLHLMTIKLLAYQWQLWDASALNSSRSMRTGAHRQEWGVYYE